MLSFFQHQIKMSYLPKRGLGKKRKKKLLISIAVKVVVNHQNERRKERGKIIY